MLVIALLAVLAGAAGPTAIDRWSALKEELLARVLDAPPGNNAENLAWLRKLALCLLKAEKTSKAKSIQRRRHLAGWKDAYLLKVLAQIPEKRGA